MIENKNGIKGQVRQGDVLLNPVAAAGLRGEDGRENGRAILAYGEATGHAHELMPAHPNDMTLDFFPAGHELFLGNRLLVVTAPAVPLRHQEHSEILTNQGTFDAIRQSEYDPAEFRSVQD